MDKTDPRFVNPIDQDLDRLENDMRKLKVEYDIYFNGAVPKPPFDSKNRLETSIKRLYDARGLTFAQRFRYNGLVARYNVMRELWRRQTKDREMGRLPTAEASAASRTYTVVVRCHDPKLETDKVAQIYEQLVAAKRECGERVGALTLEVFSEFLKSRSDQIKRHLSAAAVDFVVGVNNGEVKFAARPAQDE